MQILDLKIQEGKLKKLEEIEKNIQALSEDPYIGSKPRYALLRRKGYLVLILKKDLVFYRVDENTKTVTVHAVVDQRQDYLSLLRGLL